VTPTVHGPISSYSARATARSIRSSFSGVAHRGGDVVVPLVVVEPAHLARALGQRRELLVDVLELVRTEIADERPDAVLAVLGDVLHALLEVVGAGGHERGLAVHLAEQGDAGQPVGVGVRDDRDFGVLQRLGCLLFL